MPAGGLQMRHGLGCERSSYSLPWDHHRRCRSSCSLLLERGLSALLVSIHALAPARSLVPSSLIWANLSGDQISIRLKLPVTTTLPSVRRPA